MREVGDRSASVVVKQIPFVEGGGLALDGAETQRAETVMDRLALVQVPARAHLIRDV